MCFCKYLQNYEILRYMGSEQQGEQIFKTRIERIGNMANIVKPEGTYTILYSRHDRVQEIPAQFPSNLNGIFLEVSGNYLIDPLFYMSFLANRLPEDPFPQYEKVIKLAEEKMIPIYLADVNTVSFPLLDKAVLVGTAASFGETTIGLTMLAKLTQVEKKTTGEKKINRRNFLKQTATTAAALWLTTPVISNIGRIVSAYGGVGEDITANFQKMSHKLHPEQGLVVLTIRNELLAHKEEWLANVLGNKPNLATIMGAAHTQIEDAIQSSPYDRLAFLRSVSPIIKTFFTSESLYKMVRLDFNGKEWQVNNILIIPELKALFG